MFCCERTINSGIDTRRARHASRASLLAVRAESVIRRYANVAAPSVLGYARKERQRMAAAALFVINVHIRGFFHTYAPWGSLCQGRFLSSSSLMFILPPTPALLPLSCSDIAPLERHGPSRSPSFAQYLLRRRVFERQALCCKREVRKAMPYAFLPSIYVL